MANTPIVVVMNTWAEAGMEAEIEQVFKYMTDIVIQEPTCRLLKVERSISDPLHYIIYEEWDDHDEFLNVQLKRAYRRDFATRMAAVRATDSHMEIFELVYQPSNTPN